MTSKHYLSDKGIAHQLGISRSSVWRWVANGTPPHSQPELAREQNYGSDWGH